MTANKNPMAGTWTKASEVRRKFRAGKPRQNDLVIAATRSVLEGNILLYGVQEEMRNKGLSEKDVDAALILITPESSGDFIYVVPFPEIKRLPEMYGKVQRLEKAEGVLPLGVAIRQEDRESEETVVWVQPWLVNPRAVRAANKARRMFEQNETKGEF